MGRVYIYSLTHNPLHTRLLFGEQEAAFTNLPFNLHLFSPGTVPAPGDEKLQD